MMLGSFHNSRGFLLGAFWTYRRMTAVHQCNLLQEILVSFEGISAYNFAVI